jgi:Fe-S oxidoreductase
VNFEVIHMTQFLLELIRAGRLEITGRLEKTATYHDPCYLGRHNGIFDEPREILASIPGLTIREMAANRRNSFCCGGGGGRVWMETVKGERFSDLRVQQARALGADLLITACPYCISMFEDSRLILEVEDEIEVKDITEVIRDVI